MTPHRWLLATLAALLVTSSPRADDARQPADPTRKGADPRAAFDRLKALAGSWKGTVASKEGPSAEVRWEVISARTAVMETLFPGTDHEMRSVYFMDGPDLVLTHYCAMGNQPRMKLAASSTADELVFEFAGGTNLDPARDVHVHEGRIRLLDPEHMEAEWAVRDRGRQTGTNRFFLARGR